MNIGLISFHNAANYGAALQAYALEHYLEDNGYDCEYIDYQNSRRRRGYDMGFLIKDCIRQGKYKDAVKYAVGAPFLNFRKRHFDDFYRDHVKYSSKTYYTTDSLKETNGLYDCFMTGSDQIWNPEHNGSDLNFLLDFVDDDRRTMSYSSSLSVTQLPTELEEGYSRCLRRMRHLSVREQSGARLIKELTGRDAQVVLDPVFLIGKQQWLGLLPEGKDTEKYVFSYTNRKNQMERFLSKTGYDMTGKLHYKLSRFTSPLDFINPKVRVKYTMTPLEFLQYISNAELVVSASFHCISFSIIMNKLFVCFLTGNEGKDERLKNLLGSFGLMNRVFSDSMTIHDVMEPIDYTQVNQQLSALRKKSETYLLGSLKDLQDTIKR